MANPTSSPREPYEKPTVTRRAWVISQRLHDELGELLERHSPERVLADIHVSLEMWRLKRATGRT